MGHAHDTHVEEEPKSPWWLPVLGIALLVVGATYFLSPSSSDPPSETKGSAGH
ncbi:MAG: hypothetical protein KBF88_04885 [Polyangiaceae bacterium]|nr:hypothetical protein [Polyangiaceae bacterium]